MSTFLKSKNRLGLLGGMISLAAAIAAANAGDVLLYSDHSPGSLAAYVAWNEYFEENEDVVFLVNTTGAFETLLEMGPWDHIVVLERFSSSQPSYVEALQDEASLGTPVDFEIWHDNGIAQSNTTAVSGVTALVAWRNEHTAIKYSSRSSPQACVEGGFAFPDFQGIDLADPLILVEVSPEESEPRASIFALLIIPPCAVECLDRWVGDMEACSDNYNTQTGQCTTLYPVPPGENIANQTSCLNTASTDLINCRNSARNRYNNCIAICMLPQQ